jgi:hypothetical protein
MRERRPGIHLLLEIEAHTGRVNGTIRAAGEGERRFSGYVELVSLIEEIRADGDAVRSTPAVRAGRASSAQRPNVRGDVGV